MGWHLCIVHPCRRQNAWPAMAGKVRDCEIDSPRPHNTVRTHLRRSISTRQSVMTVAIRTLGAAITSIWSVPLNARRQIRTRLYTVKLDCYGR